MTAWLRLALALLTLAGAIVAWLRERDKLGQAENAILARQLRGMLDDIELATKAREAVRAGLAADPGRLREPDRFRRAE